MTDATGVTRRWLLGGAAGAGGALLVGAAGCAGVTGADTPSSSPGGSGTVPFYGPHQAGIATAAQDHLVFASYDVTAAGTSGLIALLRAWSDAAARMTDGQPVRSSGGREPPGSPTDTGETVGLTPSALTVTVGFGPSLFDGRFGLAGKRPAALVDVPTFPGDALDPQRSFGDLCVQACSNDPQVVFHAVRNLTRLGHGTATLRWTQLGFRRATTEAGGPATPRNLMGFKDGTNNLRGDDDAAMQRYVWVGAESDQPWMRGGSYLATRRIRMRLDKWDGERQAEQENVFGRYKASGAPLGSQAESDRVDLAAKRSDGKPVIPSNAHIRVASPESHAGQRILRRGYSYADGLDVRTGQLDAGLFFVAYQRDPRLSFIPIQNAVAAQDALNEYVTPLSSGLFAVPPGLRGPGDWFGSALLS